MELKAGYKQTAAGVIPEDWKIASLGELSACFSGGTPATSNSRYYDGSIPWINSSDLNCIRINEVEGRISIDGLANSAAKMIKEGTLLVALYGATAGVSAVSEIRAAINQAVLAILPKGIAKEYLFQLLRLHRDAYINTYTQGGQPNLSGEIVKLFPIPYPPTQAEQEAIAEALSDADVLIESLKQLLAKKRQIKQGAMQELLTGKRRLPGFWSEAGKKQTTIGIIPRDWDVIYAADACAKIQDGTHFSPKAGGSDYLYITSKNIKFGYLDTSSAARINAVQHQAIYRRCDVKKGDLLLTKDGANTGNAALNTLDEEFSLLSSIAFLRFLPGQYCASYFLQQILSAQGQRRIQDAMAGNAITRLTLGKIKNLRFAVPPTKSEQEAIATILSGIDAEIETLQTKLAKAHQIKQGMMQELLTGRIRLV
jgi:type I restriction enzyme S subunit